MTNERFFLHDIVESLGSCIDFFMAKIKFLAAFLIEGKRTTFKTALWNFFITQVLGVEEAVEIGDRYEVTRVVEYPQNITLGERVLYLHNNKIVQNLTLTGPYGNTISELAGILGTDLLKCGDRLNSENCSDLIRDILDVDFTDCKLSR